MLRVCPLIQAAHYRGGSPFVVSMKAVTDKQGTARAMERVQQAGLLYVTGSCYSRLATDRVLCRDENSVVKKTGWVTQVLIPALESSGLTVKYFNAEDELQINALLGGELPLAAAGDLISSFHSKLTAATASSQVLVLDECHWLFPFEEKDVNAKIRTFILDLMHLPALAKIWRTLETFRAAGKKIIFVSWLHPQDFSLTKNLGNPDYLMVFRAPVVEMPFRDEEEL